MGYFKILIKNGNLFDGYNFCGKKDVFIADGKIQKIGDKLTDTADFTFDVDGKIISPGFVDIHTHILGVSHSNLGTSADGSTFPFGVTTAVDCCSEFGDRSFLEALQTKIFAFVPVWIKNGLPDFKTAENLINKYGDRTLGVKAYFDLTVSRDVSITNLKKICDFAHTKGLKVMVHCSHSPSTMYEIIDILSKGDILTHIYHGDNNICLLDDCSVFRLAKEKGIVMDTGFAGHVHTDFDVLKSATSNGYYPDTISTDITNLSAFIRGGNYGLTLCMSVCKHFGMSEAEVLRAVTSSAGLAIGKSELGTIEVGKTADVAVINYETAPFDFSSFTANGIKGDMGYKCYLTVSNGQIVYKV